MTSTFDTTGGPVDRNDPDYELAREADEHDDADEPVDGLDTLALLEEAAATKIEAEPEVIEIPGLPLRLVCSTDIPSKRLTSWQRRALPPKLRSAAQVSPLAMDQAVFSSAVLVHTCTSVQVRRKGAKADDEGAWRTITDSDGNVLTLSDRAVWERLKALDSATAVKRLFPRDADLLRAGQQVLTAAGWTEEAMYGLDEEGEDPTS
jgi:hypothetical protein